MDDPQDLVSVYQATNVTEAFFVRNLLVDDEIPSVVSEGNEPLAGSAIDPPVVWVKRADEARARSLVAEYEREQEERAERPDWVCKACGAKVIGAFDECDKCGADRPTE